MAGRRDDHQSGHYTRREALAAMAKYSAAVGGAAATIVTADGLVSSASAYWSAEKWEKFCRKHPTHWKCTGRGTSTTGNGGGPSQRVRF